MSSYQAPLRDMHFALEMAGLSEISKLPGFEEAAEMAEPILAEAANFASNVLDPLNVVGDREGAKWVDGDVRMPKGFKEAYHQFGEAGWIGLPMPPEYGGQGLPQLLSTATLEMWNASNMGFALGPLLNQGAIEAILLYASDELKKIYVENLVSGKWTGTMDLTEPQAGSDLAAVSTRAVPEGDHYRITGNKIFITYGEHDMAENIVHLVLARTPTAPPGVKGISLFIVPKFLVNADGSVGARNDVNCASIEHKIGIHASPTAVLNYGEKDGAIGYLVGEENKGLSYMFVMMNLARFSVGVQGLAVSDRAYQRALEYSKERIQSAQIGSKDYKPVAIFNHPDVRRMLLTVKSTVEAQRALAFVTAAAMDHASANPDEAVRKESQAFVELMTPIVKGWSTETSTELTSLSMQVQGGMGYVEETGACQYFRDARITPIYEGTTAIQANDLLGRKLLKDQGKTASVVIGQMTKLAEALATSENADLKATGEMLGKAVAALGDASMWLGMNAMANLPGAFAGSVPYLMLWGTVAGGWQLARGAQFAAEKLAAGDRETDFYQAKILTARFYADHILPRALAYRHEIKNGSGSILAMTEAQFGADRKTLSTV